MLIGFQNITLSTYLNLVLEFVPSSFALHKKVGSGTNFCSLEPVDISCTKK